MENKRRTVAVYIRTAIKGEGVLIQEALLCGFLSSDKNNPLYLARTKTFVDDGYSGLSTNRPGLNALLEAVKSKQVDAVLVVELSRLSRSITAMYETALAIDEAGCELWELASGSRINYSGLPVSYKVVGGAQ